jgi:periplasmic mercuric ion binding protein
MKKFLLLVLSFAGFAAANAQTKPVLSAVIKTPNALCESCKSRIEAYVKRYDGVLEISVNYRKGETKVKYITDRTDIEQIKCTRC